MREETVLTHAFVEYIPDELQDGMLYISTTYATVAHTCCCGCGNQVITPLSSTDWKLIFDGESISLDPSIGNWNFACQSHYWIRRNRVRWASKWSQKEIHAGRIQDTLAKERYYDSNTAPNMPDTTLASREAENGRPEEGFWQKLKKWLFQ